MTKFLGHLNRNIGHGVIYAKEFVRHSLYHPGKRLLQIRDQIVDIFDTD